MSMTDLTSKVLRTMPLPDVGEGDKQARGNVLVIGGSATVPGAVLLAGVAALRAGAGRLRIATCERNATPLALAVPEALVLGLPETEDGGIHPTALDKLHPFVKGADAILIGPGMTDQNAIDGLACGLFAKIAPGPRFVLDARAIGSLRQLGPLLEHHARSMVVTPHAGEMAGLLDHDRSEIEVDPERHARKA